MKPELRQFLNELLPAIDDVIQILREYDESFPYAQKEGDDEKAHKLLALGQKIGAHLNEG